jgi:hypothetical protein
MSVPFSLMHLPLAFETDGWKGADGAPRPPDHRQARTDLAIRAAARLALTTALTPTTLRLAASDRIASSRWALSHVDARGTPWRALGPVEYNDPACEITVD